MAAIGAGNQNITTAAKFIPEIWSDETIAAYKSNLVAANLVTRLSHKGKKGDTINIPKPVRGSANLKVKNVAVNVQDDTHGDLSILIDKHYEYSVLMEDIAAVQALASLRKFYTDDAGYALAKQVDNDILALAEGFTGGTTTDKSYDTAYIGTGATAFTGTNEAAITEAGIRAFILALDNADVPMDNRALILPPVAASAMLAIARFTEQQFIGNGDAIKTGKIGQIYGVDVFVSTNCPTVKANGGTGNSAGGTERVGIMMHKDALVMVEQVGIRSQTQYKQEWLGDLYTSDTIYGVGELRNESGVAFVMPA
tara:strand:+ start:919 stop:1851 length:933 start_codon:yes stop_codon:yes gene_type:complete